MSQTRDLGKHLKGFVICIGGAFVVGTLFSALVQSVGVIDEIADPAGFVAGIFAFAFFMRRYFPAEDNSTEQQPIEKPQSEGFIVYNSKGEPSLGSDTGGRLVMFVVVLVIVFCIAVIWWPSVGSLSPNHQEFFNILALIALPVFMYRFAKTGIVYQDERRALQKARERRQQKLEANQAAIAR